MEIVAEQAETSLIAALIMYPDRVWPIVQPLVRERHLTSRDRVIIWRAIEATMSANEALDPVTLGERIAITQPDGDRWQMVLISMVENAAAIDNVEAYAKIIVDRFQRRQLVKIGVSIQRAAVTAESAEVCYADALNLLTTELGSHNARELVTMHRVVDGLIKGWSSDESSGQTYGLLDLDHFLNPMRPGDFVVIGARPSMGKTTLALNIAEHVAAQGGVVYFRSAEMDRESIAEKSLASVSGVSYAKILEDGKGLGEEEWRKLTSGIAKLKKSVILIEDSGGPTSADIRADALRARFQAGGKLSLMVIDYLQLMQGSGENRTSELQKITRDLKQLAKEMECPLILLSQLNREVEKRNPPRPRLSDLRESGSIEQDADVVLLLYRESEYIEDSNWGRITEVIIGKQRKGPRNRTAYILFDNTNSRFLSADRNEVQRLKGTNAYEEPEHTGFEWQHN